MKIKISRFKSIKCAEFDLGKINVFVGGNNAGKSSVLQAIQFATGVAQTVKAFTKQQFRSDSLSTTLIPEQLIYSPAKDPYTLGYGKANLSVDIKEAICVEFFDDDSHTTKVTIRKGKNKNISIKIDGQLLGEKLQDIGSPFSMYVTGLAGIPADESVIATGDMRRLAAKGNSNTILRNVLYRINKDVEKNKEFEYSWQNI